jgi:hypothetical protein
MLPPMQYSPKEKIIYVYNIGKKLDPTHTFSTLDLDFQTTHSLYPSDNRTKQHLLNISLHLLQLVL